jgi:hypothetical protein
MNPEYYYIVNDAAFGPFATASGAKAGAENEGHTRYGEVIIVRSIAQSRTETIVKTHWTAPYDLYKDMTDDEKAVVE